MWEVFITLFALGIFITVGFLLGKNHALQSISENFILKKDAKSQRSILEKEINRLEILLNEARGNFNQEVRASEQLRNQVESLKKKIIVGESEDINLSVKALSNFV